MSEQISFGRFLLYPSRRVLLRDNIPVRLGSRALDILILLASRPGQVVSHKELFARVWPDIFVEEANLRVQVAAIRKALGDGRADARFIATVAARGYCFVAHAEAETLGLEPPAQRLLAVRRQEAMDEVAELLAQFTRSYLQGHARDFAAARAPRSLIPAGA